MRTVHCAALSWGCLALVTAAPLRAQTCDYKLLSANWTRHPSPDSIYVNYSADVDGPSSADPAHPTEYDMAIAIHFNGAPLGDQHTLTLRWWHGITCTA